MANQYSPKLSVNTRGTELVINKLAAQKKALVTAQFSAGNSLGTFFVGEAYRIIRTKAPLTKGKLAASVEHNTNRIRNGWKTRIFTNLPYAAVVEGGGPPEYKQLDSALRDWVETVLGPEARKGLQYKRAIYVRTGGNPNYDTGTGMRFFQDPFIRYQNRISAEYFKRVKQALVK